MKCLASLLANATGLALVFCVQTATARPVTIGYAAAFRGLDASINHPSAARYTHINIAFGNPGPDGAIFRGDSLACFPTGEGTMLTRQQLKEGVARLQAKGVSVLVSVAGGVIPACSGNWAQLLTPEKRPQTVRNLVSLVDEVGLNGLDIDIEGTLLTEIDKAGNFTPFIAALSAELKRRRKLLTCATASYEGGMIPKSSIPFFDLVNVMSYDAIGPTWGPAGVEHATLEMARRDLALWRERGVPKDRLVLGVPFYGYGFGSYRPNWTYSELATSHGAAAKRTDLIGQACAGCSYITYNSPRTIRAKAKLARKQAAGVMVWEISQDSPKGALLNALQSGLKHSR
jgi:GH18 family chitinase